MDVFILNVVMFALMHVLFILFKYVITEHIEYTDCGNWCLDKNKFVMSKYNMPEAEFLPLFF